MTAVPEAEGADPVGGKVVRSVSLGVLHRNDRYPHLYWQNFLSLNITREVSADVVIAEADRLFADLPIRHVVVTDAEAAEHLRPGFLKCGWREGVHVFMVVRRPFDREPPAAELVEVGAAELGPTVEAYIRGGPEARDDEDVHRELCQLKEELGRSGVRFLAARLQGEFAGWCEMRRSEAEGCVEDVVVLEPFRGRGLARALVCGAVERLQIEGCDPIFVIADDKGTVKDLYSRLGFDEDRRRWSFWWPGPY